jgi:outer membrane protein W
MKLSYFKTSAKLASALIASLALMNQASAAEDGFYLGLDGNVSIGPSTVTAAPGAFPANANYNSTQTFGFANDGRFQYDGALGYIKNNFGVELKYISLGSQKQISQNGAALTADQTGTYVGKYYGINGKYFIPVNEGKQDFHLTVGVGRLSNTLTANNSTTTTPTSNLSGTQNETALMLGVGVRFNINKTLGLNAEVNRITPVSHGLLNSGIYNNAYTVLSLGFVVSF